MSKDSSRVAWETEWYLLRTKTGEERRAHAQLSRLAADALLPLVKARARRWGRMVESVGPLFPCYLFAAFDLKRQYRCVSYTRGIRELVRCGGEPAVVPEQVISELKERCARGPVELPRRQLLAGERVRVVDGLFREFEGIFEQYLSGQERVAILLRSMSCGARAVLPAGMVTPEA